MSDSSFRVGDSVRVRTGVMDPDCPDLSLAGWTGIVREWSEDGRCLVAWNKQTLAGASEEHRRRCEAEELDWDTCWLADADLELITSARARTPEALARRILQLAEDDELPPVNLEHLGRFYRHFQNTLSCPFPAMIDLSETEFGTGVRPVMVLRVLPPERSLPTVGLMAEIAVDESRTEVPLGVLEPIGEDSCVEDLTAYAVWICEYLPPTFTPRRPTYPYALLGVALALIGGVAGSVIASVPGAEWGAMIGAGMLAVVTFLALARYETFFRLVNRLPQGGIGGAVIGFLAGALAGAALGAVLVAFVGSIPGAILGTLLGGFLRRKNIHRPGTVFLTFAGAGVGAVTLALWIDWYMAVVGMAIGLGFGVVAGGLLVFAAMVYLNALFHSDLS